MVPMLKKEKPQSLSWLLAQHPTLAKVELVRAPQLVSMGT